MRLADIAQKQGKLEQALEMERKYSAYLDSAQQKQQGAAIVTTEKNILIQRKQSEFKTNLGQLYYYITTGTVPPRHLQFPAPRCRPHQYYLARCSNRFGRDFLWEWCKNLFQYQQLLWRFRGIRTGSHFFSLRKDSKDRCLTSIT